jgi:hypothetical protein
MKNYNSLLEAVTDLRNNGYSEDFNLQPHCIECATLKLQWEPEKFTIDEFYRFEGMSNPDDSSIIFAISSEEGIKGTLIDAYGMYAENLSEGMIKKLTIKR